MIFALSAEVEARHTKRAAENATVADTPNAEAFGIFKSQTTIFKEISNLKSHPAMPDY